MARQFPTQGYPGTLPMKPARHWNFGSVVGYQKCVQKNLCTWFLRGLVFSIIPSQLGGRSLFPPQMSADACFIPIITSLSLHRRLRSWRELTLSQFIYLHLSFHHQLHQLIMFLQLWVLSYLLTTTSTEAAHTETQLQSSGAAGKWWCLPFLQKPCVCSLL